jgi:ATP synthase protein I
VKPEDRADPPSPAGRGDPGFAAAMRFGLSAGGQFVSGTVLGGVLGWALDRWLGTAPYGMLILMALCFIAAMANVWRTMSRAVSVATETASSAERAGAETKVDAKKVTEKKIDGKSA